MVKIVVAALLATSMSVDAVSAQGSMQVPYGGDKPAPVSVTDPAGPDDTPEEIAKDSARDLKDNRFYNKPGATRAQYDKDWQACRLIARGSRTPTGTVPYYYNPALVSPLAARIGGGIGGLIAGAIAQGQQRRDNRRNCLLIRGWRVVEIPPAQAAKVAAFTDDQRDAYFNSIVGAATVDGIVTERTTFTQPSDPALALDAPVSGPMSVYLDKKVDPAAPFVLAPGEAAVVIAYRRADAGSAGRSAAVQLARYDVKGRDLMYRPKDWKKNGNLTTYLVDAPTKDGKAPYEVQVLRVTPGDYVVAATAVNNKLFTSSNCFGAPTFHVDAGQVAYLGEFIPYWNVKLASGAKASTLAYTTHIADTRRALATTQPALAAALTPVGIENGATFACSAITMDRWDIPGAPMIAPAVPVAN